MPHLAVLGEQPRHSRGLAADARRLPRRRPRRIDIRRGNHSPTEGDQAVMTDEVRARVRAIYAEADAAVAAAGPKCDASGRCCHFTEWGHVLYLSTFEAEILLDAAPPYAKPVSPDGCPFQVDNLC